MKMQREEPTKQTMAYHQLDTVRSSGYIRWVRLATTYLTEQNVKQKRLSKPKFSQGDMVLYKTGHYKNPSYDFGIVREVLVWNEENLKPVYMVYFTFDSATVAIPENELEIVQTESLQRLEQDGETDQQDLF